MGEQSRADVRTAMADRLTTNTVKPEFRLETLMRKVASMYGTTVATVGDTSQRLPEVIRARHGLWWLLRQAGWSYPQIAAIHNTDPSTVYAGLHRDPPYEPDGDIESFVSHVPRPETVTSFTRDGPPHTVSLHAKVPKPLADDLDIYAASNGWTRAEAIRRAVAVMVHTDYGQKVDADE